MTYEEAEQLAIDAGALEPQGIGEHMARNIKTNENWFFKWAQTPRAQERLRLWTDAILRGTHPSDCKRRIG